MARNLNVDRKTVDSDQYVYREERDLSKTRVDWGTVGKELTDTINTIRDERETQKAEIEQGQVDSMNTLGEFDQYNNKSLNESVLEGSEWSKNALSTQFDLMRRGLITPSEYKRFEQRSKDSFSSLKGNLDNFATHYDEASLRVQNGESNIGEVAVNASISGLANLGEYELSGNPATGELCYIKTGVNPETNKPYDPKDPANQISLAVINSRINQKMDYVATSDAALGEVDKLGEVVDATILAQQGVKTMEDWRLLEGSEEMMDRMIGVITNSDSQKLSILQEAGYNSDDFTQDPNTQDPNHKDYDPSKILMTPNPNKSGAFVFEFNEEQGEKIRRNAELALEAQISQKAGFTKGFAEPVDNQTTAGQDERQAIGANYLQSSIEFVTGDKGLADAAANNLVNEFNKNLKEGEKRIEWIERAVETIDHDNDPDTPDQETVVGFNVFREGMEEPKLTDTTGMTPQQAVKALYGKITPGGTRQFDMVMKEGEFVIGDTYGTGSARGQGEIEEYGVIDMTQPLAGMTKNAHDYAMSELGGDLQQSWFFDNAQQVEDVYTRIIEGSVSQKFFNDVGGSPHVNIIPDGDTLWFEVGETRMKINDMWDDATGKKPGDDVRSQLRFIEKVLETERQRIIDKKTGRTSGGGASSGGGGTPAPSDIRIKNNINLVGTSPNGHNIYTFMYKDPSKHLEGMYQGVMAQEVPHATVQVGEELWVDYNKLDVDFIKVS